MTEQAALEIVWDYMLMKQPLKQADVIIVLGSREVSVAEWAANLYEMHLSPQIVITGGQTPGALAEWGMGEAEKFQQVMLERGVPASAIWIEDKATNTGENAKFSGELLREHGLQPDAVIVVTKPYMERRAFATFMKWWPQWKLCLSSPAMDLDEWIAQSAWSKSETINLMVGDLWRIKTFPARGFQIEQAIPDSVNNALEVLTELGYGRVVRPGAETKPA